MLRYAPHPLLDAVAFTAMYPTELDALRSPAALTDLFTPGASAPMQSGDEVRKAVRDLLRHGGFKPTGRSKPASEYLLKASESGALGSINAAVDGCNAASLHSGLPISVVDLDKVVGALSVDVAPPGSSYVFNASGQEIDLSGLVCLFDEAGPCANAVKDSQRTKTHGGTTCTLAVVWGTRALPGLAEATARWYRELVEAHFGAITRDARGDDGA